MKYENLNQAKITCQEINSVKKILHGLESSFASVRIYDNDRIVEDLLGYSYMEGDVKEEVDKIIDRLKEFYAAKLSELETKLESL